MAVHTGLCGPAGFFKTRMESGIQLFNFYTPRYVVYRGYIVFAFSVIIPPVRSIAGARGKGHLFPRPADRMD